MTTSEYLLVTSSTNMKSSYLKLDRSVPRRYVFTFSWTSYKTQTSFCIVNTLEDKKVKAQMPGSLSLFGLFALTASFWYLE